MIVFWGQGCVIMSLWVAQPSPLNSSASWSSAGDAASALFDCVTGAFRQVAAGSAPRRPPEAKPDTCTKPAIKPNKTNGANSKQLPSPPDAQRPVVHRKGAPAAEALAFALVSLKERHEAALLAGSKALQVAREQRRMCTVLANDAARQLTRLLT